MKEYGGIQVPPIAESDDSESDAVATPPPPIWSEFKTPLTNRTRRKGQAYVTERIIAGKITPTVRRVQEKVVKATDIMVIAGQLSTEYLKAMRVKEQARASRNDSQGKIIQKYGEIYGN